MTAEEVTAQRRKDRKVTKTAKKHERDADKAETLAISARKNQAAIGGDGVITLRQPHDGVMDTGEFRGCDDLPRIGIIQPRDNVLYRLPKQRFTCLVASPKGELCISIRMNVRKPLIERMLRI